MPSLNGALYSRNSVRLILRCVIPIVLSNNKNKLNGTYTYVYRHKHNYIPCSTFTITKVQLHVSTINVGHLQIVPFMSTYSYAL